ncbi:hypothetical protein QFC19_004236 [Naganishia cerealis]|uniref:Uncharacterized protein n=1 Tax=Naganishia cerealis TaxID=610337 RepID=A0ACC2VYF4_9TREE|nr:hypothetical protein QFC19_004236 [Naganishia cerealis]
MQVSESGFVLQNNTLVLFEYFRKACICIRAPNVNVLQTRNTACGSRQTSAVKLRFQSGVATLERIYNNDNLPMSDTESVDSGSPTAEPPDEPVEKSDDADTDSVSSNATALEEIPSAPGTANRVADAASSNNTAEGQEVASISISTAPGKAQVSPDTPSTISQRSTTPLTHGPSTGASTMESNREDSVNSVSGVSNPASVQNTSVESAPSSLPLDDKNIFFRHDDGKALVKALAPQRGARWKDMEDANLQSWQAKRKEEKDKEVAKKARIKEDAREYIPPSKPPSIYSSIDEDSEEKKSPSDVSSHTDTSSLKSSSSSEKNARVDDSLHNAQETTPLSKKATSVDASTSKGRKPLGLFERFGRWLVSSRCR